MRLVDGADRESSQQVYDTVSRVKAGLDANDWFYWVLWSTLDCCQLYD